MFGTNLSDVYLTNVELGLKQAIDPSTYSVTPSAGSVNPDSVQSVDAGATTSFTVTADEGYSPSTAVKGTCPSGSWIANEWTTGAIYGDCTVIFNFETEGLIFRDGFE